MPPKVLIFESKKELFTYLTNEIAKQIKSKQSSVLGLSTGRTMLPLYSNKKFRSLEFSKVTTFNQDEYFHPKNYSESFHNFMTKKFINKTNMRQKNFHILPYNTQNPQQACKEYEKAITKAKIDLQILGLGRNGHIGFNEPGSSFNSKTRIVDLAKSTRKANHSKTKRALTIGISTTLEAKKIILVATGRHKALAVKALLEKPISKKYPASILRKHPKFLVLLDKQAAHLLKQKR